MGTPAIITTPLPQAPGDDGWPEGRELYPEELETLARVRIPAARAFLTAYAMCWSKAHACRVVDRSPQCVIKWRADPPFAELWEALSAERLENWRHYSARKAREGFHKRVYTVDSEGNPTLKHHEVREDPSHLKAVMGSIDPDYRQDKNGGDLQITIVRVHE